MSTVGTYVASAQRSERFRSSTQIFVSNSQIDAIVGGGQVGGNDRSTLDQAKLVLSRAVTERVIKRLRLPDTPVQLTAAVTATPVTGSNFVTVVAERSSGVEAAAVANEYARQYIRVRNEQLTDDASQAIKRIRGQLTTLPNRTSTQQQRQNLQETIRQLQVTQATAPSQTRQTDEAVVSATPFAPKPRRDALFALVISIGLGVALAFALERFDRRIKTVEEVAALYGVPLLSSVPHTTTLRAQQDGGSAVPESLREPFRSLRTNLHLASLDRPIRRLVVASAISGEGKSTVVRNLALTYCEWGLSVVVLEADLRRPTLSAAFAVGADSPGLTGVLTGDCSLDDALVDVAVDIPNLDLLLKLRAGDQQPRSAGLRTTTENGLALLPSGATPPNPQVVLAADKMRQVIDDLSTRFDIVLIDTPPLLAVSDAMPLLPQADGVILLTRIGMTERWAAHKAVHTAHLDPSVKLLGVVANDVAFEPGSSYGYGYGGYGYASNNGRKL